MKHYVVCPHTITSPAADPEKPPYLPPNVPCGQKVPIWVATLGVMELRCPRGHVFFADASDIEDEAA